MVSAEEHEKVDWAVEQFDQAVTTLCGPRMENIDGRYVTRASRYQEIREQARLTADAPTHRSGSTAPAWIDGLDWLRNVDRTVCGWSYGLDTPGRLQRLTEAPWRPQDLEKLADYTDACLSWAKAADGLLDPKRRWEVAAACPRCEKSVVYRRDGLGESVKVPALSITVDGCECLSCHEVWGPELYEYLARLLGCKPIEGVVADGRMGA